MKKGIVISMLFAGCVFWLTACTGRNNAPQAASSLNETVSDDFSFGEQALSENPDYSSEKNPDLQNDSSEITVSSEEDYGGESDTGPESGEKSDTEPESGEETASTDGSSLQQIDGSDGTVVHDYVEGGMPLDGN